VIWIAVDAMAGLPLRGVKGVATVGREIAAAAVSHQ